MHRLGGHVLGFADVEDDAGRRLLPGVDEGHDPHARVLRRRHRDAALPAGRAGGGRALGVRSRSSTAATAGASTRPRSSPTSTRSRRSSASIDGLTFLLVGDMRMRTMHSILYALSQFDAKAYVVGPPEMSLTAEFMLELDERNVALRGGRVDRRRDRRVRRDLHGAGRPGRLHAVARRARRRRRRPRGHRTVVPGHPRAPPREGEDRLDHPAQPPAHGRAARRTSTRRVTRATGRRRSTASSCGWRSSPSCWARWSNGDAASPSTGSPSTSRPRDGREPARAAPRASSGCGR